MPYRLTSSDPLWQELTHPRVRELAWCLFSPSVMANGKDNAALGPPLNDHWRDALRALDHNPQPLLQWFEHFPHRRLGFIFEHYWQFWWVTYGQANGEYRFNHVIFDKGRTTGEVDVLCWDVNTATLTHGELAIKFYLGLSEQLAEGYPSDWYGPNTKDKLSKKWHHVREEQLGHHAYETLGLPRHWHWQHLKTQLITRGRLFYPHSSVVAKDTFPTPIADKLDPQHERGTWLRLCNLAQLDEGFWYPLPRAAWLAPARIKLASAYSRESLIAWCSQHFTQPDSAITLQSNINAPHIRTAPLQIVKLQPHGDEGFETERLFVLPDEWPPERRR